MPRTYCKYPTKKQLSLLIFRERYKRLTGAYPTLEALSVREGTSKSSVRKVLESGLRNVRNTTKSVA